MTTERDEWSRLRDRVEDAIDQAIADGDFDNLPGFGKPIPGDDRELEPDWWLKEKLRREQLSVLPPLLEAKLVRHQFLERLPTFQTEYEVRRELCIVNEAIRTAHYDPKPSPPVVVMPLEEHDVLARWAGVRRACG